LKFLLIGHCAVDIFHGSRTTERFGGIINSAIALASVAGPRDTIIPVCGVHADDADALLAHLARFPAIATDAIFSMKAATNRVEYYPRTDGPMVACPKEIAPPIPFEKIKPFLGCDGIHLNMISGFDITLECLDTIRMAVRGENIPVHLDFHNLTLGVNERHERFRRPLELWRRWAFMIDTVQGNTEEIGGLSLERMTEERTVGHILSLGVKAVIVTRGMAGVTLYSAEHKVISRKDFATGNGVHVTLPVGAGDAFGAGFLFRYASSHDPAVAVEDGIQTALTFLTAAGQG
jgi:sugar/nucleoside kinase (ribokinase family)